MRGTMIKEAFVKTIPVMAGYLVLGAAFGILLESKGYGVLWALLMSTTIYAGSMQFVAVDLLSVGAGFLSIGIMTFLVNARHLIYGVSMLNHYRGMGKIKPYLMGSLTDETYALLCMGAPKNYDKKLYYFIISLCNQLYWIIGSVVGTLIGGALTIETKGIEFSMTALFVIIFVEQWKSNEDHVPAYIGVLVTLGNLWIFGTQNFLIPSMIMIVSILSFRVIKKMKGEKDE